MNSVETEIREMGYSKINLQIRTTNDKISVFFHNLVLQNDHVISMGKLMEAYHS